MCVCIYIYAHDYLIPEATQFGSFRSYMKNKEGTDCSWITKWSSYQEYTNPRPFHLTEFSSHTC